MIAASYNGHLEVVKYLHEVAGADMNTAAKVFLGLAHTANEREM